VGGSGVLVGPGRARIKLQNESLGMAESLGGKEAFCGVLIPRGGGGERLEEKMQKSNRNQKDSQPRGKCCNVARG